MKLMSGSPGFDLGVEPSNLNDNAVLKSLNKVLGALVYGSNRSGNKIFVVFLCKKIKKIRRAEGRGPESGAGRVKNLRIGGK